MIVWEYFLEIKLLKSIEWKGPRLKYRSKNRKNSIKAKAATKSIGASTNKKQSWPSSAATQGTPKISSKLEETPSPARTTYKWTKPTSKTFSKTACPQKTRPSTPSWNLTKIWSTPNASFKSNNSSTNSKTKPKWTSKSNLKSMSTPNPDPPSIS